MGLADDYTTAAQEVTITPSGASDLYGQGTAGTAATVRARFSRRIRLVRTARGEELQSVAQVLLGAAVAVAVDDKVTFAGTTYPVVTVEEAYDLGGQVMHRVAYLGA